MFADAHCWDEKLSKRFLIGHLARFGDCLFATTIAKQLKFDFPDCHVTWAIAKSFQSILKDNPFVDNIWVIDSGMDHFYGEVWYRFEKEALQRKNAGEFDNVFFSQVGPRNLRNFTGTIRESILNNFKGKITVSLDPVVRLSQDEICLVEKFVEENHLNKYKFVTLFECAPASGQSKMTLDAAIRIAKIVAEKNDEIAFIISSSSKIESDNKKIIDGSILPFKHNAELTKYCNLFVGCSSGLTWLVTSDWAKQLPMIQVLDKKSQYFAGVAYDFMLNGLKNDHIIEMLEYSEQKIVDAIELSIQGKWDDAKNQYNEEYKVSHYNFKGMNRSLLSQNHYIQGFFQVFKYQTRHCHLSFIILILYYLQNCIELLVVYNIFRVGRAIKKVVTFLLKGT
jgi:hypothetical protein